MLTDLLVVATLLQARESASDFGFRYQSRSCPAESIDTRTRSYGRDGRGIALMLTVPERNSVFQAIIDARLADMAPEVNQPDPLFGGRQFELEVQNGRNNYIVRWREDDAFAATDVGQRLAHVRTAILDAIAAHQDVLQSFSDSPCLPGQQPTQGATASAGPGGLRPRVQPPRKTRWVTPIYPPDAAAAGIKGVVLLEVTIDRDGKVHEPKVLRSIPLLDEAALDAVTHWEFSPSLINGAPVPSTITVAVPVGQ